MNIDKLYNVRASNERDHIWKVIEIKGSFKHTLGVPIKKFLFEKTRKFDYHAYHKIFFLIALDSVSKLFKARIEFVFVT